MSALELRDGLEPLALHDRALATWWSRPDVADWPIPKGRVRRQADGRLAVTLNAESRRSGPTYGNILLNTTFGIRSRTANKIWPETCPRVLGCWMLSLNELASQVDTPVKLIVTELRSRFTHRWSTTIPGVLRRSRPWRRGQRPSYTSWHRGRWWIKPWHGSKARFLLVPSAKDVQ